MPAVVHEQKHFTLSGLIFVSLGEDGLNLLEFHFQIVVVSILNLDYLVEIQTLEKLRHFFEVVRRLLNVNVVGFATFAHLFVLRVAYQESY